MFEVNKYLWSFNPSFYRFNVFFLVIFFMSVSTETTAHANYSSIGQALGSGDVSAAVRMMNANKSISPSTTKHFALADALTSGNTQRVQQIITGSTATISNSQNSAQTQTREIANAMTTGDMGKVAEIVFGQDAVIVNALSRGDVSAASKAVQQGKSIDKNILNITQQPSSGTQQPSSGTQQVTQYEYEKCVASVKLSGESAICRDPYGQFLWTKGKKDKINELIQYQPELEDKKNDLALVIDLFTQSFEQDVSNLNSTDRRKIKNNSVVKYFFSFLKEYKVNFERTDYDKIIKIRNDSNFIDSLYFTQSYEFRKLFFVNSEFKKLSDSVMNLIPKYQCKKNGSNLLAALNAKGKCSIGYIKIEV